MAGIFIVIDGIDGSGKKTQFDLLVTRLKAEGHALETADFPQYGQKSAGPVEDYLNGVYGTAEEVTPYQGSILYAVDRYAASRKIRTWLDDNKIVISNRYVSSNMGHQGGKINDPEERKRFFAWNNELEYGIFGIPKPTISIILHIPPAVAQALVDQKAARDYITGGAKRDIHEANLDHLRRAEETYLEMARLFPEYQVIECVEDGKLLSIEAVHEKVWQAVQGVLSHT